MIAKGFQARLCLLPTKPLEEFMLELPAPDLTSLYPAALHDAALSRLRRGVVYVGPGKTAVLLARWVGRSVGSAATAGSLPDICSVLGEGKGTLRGDDGSANKSFSLKERIVRERQAENTQRSAGGAAAELSSDRCFALLQVDGKAIRYPPEPVTASVSTEKRRHSLLGRKRKEETTKEAKAGAELVPAAQLEDAIFAFAGGVRMPLGAIRVSDKEDARKEASSSYTLHLWHTSALGKASQPELHEHAPDVIFHFDVVNEPFTPRTQLSNISERPSAECMASGSVQPPAQALLPQEAPGQLRPAPRLSSKRSRGQIAASAAPDGDQAVASAQPVSGANGEAHAVSAPATDAAYNVSSTDSLGRPRSANTFAGGNGNGRLGGVAGSDKAMDRTATQSSGSPSRESKSPTTVESAGSNEHLSFASQSRRLSLVEVLAADPPIGWDAAEQARREQQRAGFFAARQAGSNIAVTQSKAVKVVSPLRSPVTSLDAAAGAGGLRGEGKADSHGATENGMGLNSTAVIAGAEAAVAAGSSSAQLTGLVQDTSEPARPCARAAAERFDSAATTTPSAPLPRPSTERRETAPENGASAPALNGAEEHTEAVLSDEDGRAARRRSMPVPAPDFDASPADSSTSASAIGTVTEAELWRSRRDVAALKKQAATLEQQRRGLEELWRARQMNTVQRERREYERKIRQREQEILRLQELLAVAPPDDASIDQNGDARSELHVHTNGASHSDL